MQEEEITRQQSLAIIESMISKAKNQFSENGFMYLLWGWVILFCSLSHFVLLHFVHYPKHYLIWLLTWPTVIVQMVYLYRQRKKRAVKTYTEDIIGWVWMSFVVLMFLMGVVTGRALGDKSYTVINVCFLALYGMPTFLSGIILRFRPLVIGGICCWVLSILATFVAYDYQLLLLAAAVIIAWIVPGYLLRNRYNKENLGQ